MNRLARFFPFIVVCLMLTTGLQASGSADTAITEQTAHAPPSLDYYREAEAMRAEQLGLESGELGLFETLKVRASADSINVMATLLFFGAIIHTFLAGSFMKLSRKYEAKHQEQIRNHGKRYVEGKDPVDFKATLFHFLGEVEAIFGIWVVPLLFWIGLTHGWSATAAYIDSRNYVEPMFVVIIMAIASSRPVIAFAENALSAVASIGKHSPAAWWLSILIIAPLLGSFITEPAAMTIAAMLLGQQFYRYEPTSKFKYATLGLLFVNVSVGGTLTHFAAPPVLMVASTWEWTMPFVFLNLGLKAVVGILISTTIYFFLFKKHFGELAVKANALEANSAKTDEEPVPTWVTVVHLGFLVWTVFTLHHPALFIGGFLFFIAFTIATEHHQYAIALKGPLLVGFFLAGLVTHGGLQAWWIEPVLSSLSEIPLFLGSTLLTAFNDNAAITFLASQVPAFDPELALDPDRAITLQKMVVAGAVTGGGLTVIANAPNPAGQSLLSKYFGGTVSPAKLLVAAIFPTLVMITIFLFTL